MQFSEPLKNSYFHKKKTIKFRQNLIQQFLSTTLVSLLMTEDQQLIK